MLFVLAVAGGASAAPRAEQFQADDWVTECDHGGADCSITVPFSGEQDGRTGAFALVVMLQANEVAVVGRPYPSSAMLRVDKNLSIECHRRRYCLFPPAASRRFIAELAKGALIFVDVTAGRGRFHFSLTTKGYLAGLAEIGAWGYRFSAE